MKYIFLIILQTMSISRTNRYFILILTIMLAGMVALSPFAIDTYLVAMPSMAKYFGVEINLIELTITLYFLGLAFGNFFGGPLSDSFGRKTIALTGIALYAGSAILIAFSSKIEHIIILRVFQAFGGGFATVTSNVFVRDWFEGKQVARFITIIGMIMMLAPLVAPVVGAFLLHWSGWQSIFIFLSIFAAIWFIAFYFLIPESRDSSLITRHITINQILAKYKEFFAHKQSVILLFSISFSMAGLYIFLSDASFIYIEYFKIDSEVFPLFFCANVVANVILSLANTYLLRIYRPEQILKTGLYMQLCAGIMLLANVWFFTPNLWVIFTGIALYIGSLGFIFGNGTAVILNYNPRVSGSANATIGVTRFVLSSIIGSLIAIFHSGNLIPSCTIIFLCTLLANGLYFCVSKKAAR